MPSCFRQQTHGCGEEKREHHQDSNRPEGIAIGILRIAYVGELVHRRDRKHQEDEYDASNDHADECFDARSAEVVHVLVIGLLAELWSRKPFLLSC